FLLNATATAVIDTLSLHDALPISRSAAVAHRRRDAVLTSRVPPSSPHIPLAGAPGHEQRQETRFLQRPEWCQHHAGRRQRHRHRDRKSTRLNSSHVKISYAVFCLK